MADPAADPVADPAAAPGCSCGCSCMVLRLVMRLVTGDAAGDAKPVCWRCGRSDKPSKNLHGVLVYFNLVIFIPAKLLI
jgi:hypothetical protein